MQGANPPVRQERELSRSIFHSWGRESPKNKNWHRSGIDLASIWHRFGTDLGSIWQRSSIDLGSMWHRSGIDLGSIWDRFGDHRGASRTLPGPSGRPKNIKNQKNHQFQFLQLRFEALDELDRLVTLPRLEKKQNRPKMTPIFKYEGVPTPLYTW